MSDALRTPCAPDAKVRRGFHKHLCDDCGTCWKHRNGAGQGKRGDFQKAHSCPNCGAEQTTKHDHQLPSLKCTLRLLQHECADLEDLAAVLGHIYCQSKKGTKNA